MAVFSNAQIEALLKSAAEQANDDASCLTTDGLDLLAVAISVAYKEMGLSLDLLHKNFDGAWRATEQLRHRVN
jgi:hypothetical protein